MQLVDDEDILLAAPVEGPDQRAADKSGSAGDDNHSGMLSFPLSIFLSHLSEPSFRMERRPQIVPLKEGLKKVFILWFS